MAAGGGETLPPLPAPVLWTTDLRRLIAFYRDGAGFELVQQVPGVAATLRNGPLTLQVWQRERASPGRTSVTLDAPHECIFRLYDGLRGSAGALLDSSPRLASWGAWEFAMSDIDGNQLRFVRWRRAVSRH